MCGCNGPLPEVSLFPLVGEDFRDTEEEADCRHGGGGGSDGRAVLRGGGAAEEDAEAALRPPRVQGRC